MTIDEIYQMYMNDVYRFLLSMTKDKHLAEDLLQETFMRAYIHIHSYDHSKVKPWLFKWRETPSLITSESIRKK